MVPNNFVATDFFSLLFLRIGHHLDRQDIRLLHAR